MILRNQIANNTVFNVLGQLSNMLFALLLTPFIISKLGVSQFGVWALISIFTNYYNFIDFGISGSYVRFIAEDKAKRDDDGINRIISTGLFYNLGFSLCIVGLGFACRAPLINVLTKGNAAKVGLYDQVYSLSLILFAITYAGNIFQAVLDGIQRMDVRNITTALQKGVNAVFIVVFLQMGWRLPGLLLSGIIAAVFLIIVNYINVRRLIPSMAISHRLIDISKFKRLFDYGIRYQLTGICIWITTNINKILLGALDSMSSVAYFDVAQKLCSFARSVPISLLSPLVPAVSEAHTLGDRDKVASLYEKASRVMLFLTLPISLFILLNSEYIIQSWLGPTFLQVTLVLQILIIGNGINMLTGVGTSFAKGVNRPGMEAKYSVVSTLLNIALCLIMIPPFGVLGAAAALSITNVFGSLYFLWYFHKVQRVNNRQYIKNTILFPLSVCIAMGLVIYYINAHFYYSLPKTTRILALFVEAAAFQGGLWLILEKTNYVDLFRFLPMRKRNV